MIGEYVNAGRGKTVTINRAVPGAQYRITAWALHGNYNGGRSATPAVVYATTEEAGECSRNNVHIATGFSSLKFNVLLLNIDTCKPNVAFTRAPFCPLATVTVAWCLHSTSQRWSPVHLTYFH